MWVKIHTTRYQGIYAIPIGGKVHAKNEDYLTCWNIFCKRCLLKDAMKRRMYEIRKNLKAIEHKKDNVSLVITVCCSCCIKGFKFLCKMIESCTCSLFHPSLHLNAGNGSYMTWKLKMVLKILYGYYLRNSSFLYQPLLIFLF